MMDNYDIFARYYDLEFGQMDRDLLMIEQFAARCGSPILELACGTGRVLLPLARQGYQVTGVDVSGAMLDLARNKVAAEGLEKRVTLVQQDMRSLVLDGQFSLVFVAVNSFMHLPTADDQLAALVGIRRHLAPGGLLLLDLFNPDLSRLLDYRGQVHLDRTLVDPDTGHQVLRFRSEKVDLGLQTIYVTFMVDEIDGEGRTQRTVFPFTVRYLFRYELEHLLWRAGYTLEAVYGSYDLDEFSGESDQMIAVAHSAE